MTEQKKEVEQKWMEDKVKAYTFPKKGDQGKDYVVLFEKKSQDAGKQYNEWVLIPKTVLKEVTTTPKGSTVKYKTGKIKDKEGKWRDILTAYEVIERAKPQYRNGGSRATPEQHNETILTSCLGHAYEEAKLQMGKFATAGQGGLDGKDIQARAKELFDWIKITAKEAVK